MDIEMDTNWQPSVTKTGNFVDKMNSKKSFGKKCFLVCEVLGLGLAIVVVIGLFCLPTVFYLVPLNNNQVRPYSTMQTLPCNYTGDQTQ